MSYRDAYPCQTRVLLVASADISTPLLLSEPASSKQKRCGRRRATSRRLEFRDSVSLPLRQGVCSRRAVVGCERLDVRWASSSGVLRDCSVRDFVSYRGRAAGVGSPRAISLRQTGSDRPVTALWSAISEVGAGSGMYRSLRPRPQPHHGDARRAWAYRVVQCKASQIGAHPCVESSTCASHRRRSWRR